jgi:RNA recognition motif-containing protein
LFFPGSPLGYGFVLFERDEDATNAMNALNGHAMGNKTIRVSVAKVRSRLPFVVPVSSSTNVYVANIPYTWTTS